MTPESIAREPSQWVELSSEDTARSFELKRGSELIGRLVCTVEQDPETGSPMLRIDDLTIGQNARKNLGVIRKTVKQIKSLAEEAGARAITWSAVTFNSRSVSEKMLVDGVAEQKGPIRFVVPLGKLTVSTLLDSSRMRQLPDKT